MMISATCPNRFPHALPMTRVRITPRTIKTRAMHTFRYKPEFHFGLLTDTPDQEAAMVAFRAELKEHPERFTRFSPYFAHVSMKDDDKVVLTVAGADPEEVSSFSRDIARNNALGSVRIRVKGREMPAYVALHPVATENRQIDT